MLVMDNSPSQPIRLQGQPTSPHFGARHPLAPVAARHCASHREDLPLSQYLGRVACGACWELAIRDDERAVVEFGLPRELVSDPDLVDEVAVDRAVRGWPTELTATEQRMAVIRLSESGLNAREVAEQLGIGQDAVQKVLAARGRPVDVAEAA
jgi:hypothetical protein